MVLFCLMGSGLGQYRTMHPLLDSRSQDGCKLRTGLEHLTQSLVGSHHSFRGRATLGGCQKDDDSLANQANGCIYVSIFNIAAVEKGGRRACKAHPPNLTNLNGREQVLCTY